MAEFIVSQKILNNYAKVLIINGLGKGRNLKKGSVVYLTLSEDAKALLNPLIKEILKQECQFILNYFPEDINRTIFDYSSDKQLKWKPDNTLRGRIKDIDYRLIILSKKNSNELQGIDPKKIFLSSSTLKPYIDLINQKQDCNKLNWSIGLFGTKEMASEVGLSLKEYWDQIINACFLNSPNPVKKNLEIQENLKIILKKLNSLEIESLHMKAKDIDMHIKIGSNRCWLAGGGNNIPSFEVFTSPDWRGCFGKIKFTEKLYRFGQIIDGIELEFAKGKIIKARAKKGQKVLDAMIKQKNADKIGEFSLTDSRLSRITKFMGETLYDENVGGNFGNTHIAIGSSFKECYKGPKKKSNLSVADLRDLGFNQSIEHTDIVSKTNREVIATLKDKSQIVIYRNGRFTFL